MCNEPLWTTTTMMMMIIIVDVVDDDDGTGKRQTFSSKAQVSMHVWVLPEGSEGLLTVSTAGCMDGPDPGLASTRNTC
eukprot:2548399-Amphidinium_carterae.1